MISKTCKILIALLPGLAMAQALHHDPQTLFVKLKPNTKFSHPMVKKLDHLFLNNYLAHTEDADKLELALKSDARVISTELNRHSGFRDMPEISRDYSKIRPSATASKVFDDPMVDKIWSFKDKKNFGISVEKFYRELPLKESAPVIVAVVDTGVDYEHEDLKAAMWINKNEIADNGIDDDKNGYIDDVYGIDTLNRNPDGTASGDPKNEHYHGTHVAGTIGAVQNNHVGIAGIAKNVKIMAIKTVPGDGDETDRNVVESYLYAAKHGAKIINCSFGKRVNEGGTIVSEAIKYIVDTYGTLVVAAAGNDSMPWAKVDIDVDFHYPASYTNDNLLVIAATESSGRIASYSNVGKVSVDVAAPGSDIYSTLPDNDYGNLSGTSMATPTTVGALAVIASYYPQLNGLQLKKAIMDSVTKVDSFDKWMVTGGRIDLYQAVKALEMNVQH